MKWQSAVALGTGFCGATALTFYTTVNQIGPRFMWASDMCPQSTVSCGAMPGWIIVSVLLSSIVSVAIGRFLYKHTESELGDTA